MAGVASGLRRAAQRVLHGCNGGWAGGSAGLSTAAPAAATAAVRAGAEAGQPTAATHPDMLRPGELLPGLAATEFAARRAALAAMLPPGGVALVPAAPLVYMSGVRWQLGPRRGLGSSCSLCQASMAFVCVPEGRRREPSASSAQRRCVAAVCPPHAVPARVDGALCSPLPRLAPPLSTAYCFRARVSSLPRAQVIPYPYRQSADFLYLTGITQPYALAAVDSSRRYTLFVPDPDAWREQWDGARLGAEAAEAVFGADEALPLSKVRAPAAALALALGAAAPPPPGPISLCYTSYLLPRQPIAAMDC